MSRSCFLAEISSQYQLLFAVVGREGKSDSRVQSMSTGSTTTLQHDLHSLGRDLKAGVLDLDAFGRRTVELVGQALAAPEVSLWSVADSHAHARLTLVGTRAADHVDEDSRLRAGCVLYGTSVAEYLMLLRAASAVPLSPALIERPPLSRFIERLLPRQHASSIHASGAVNDTVVVILCASAPTAPRAWTVADRGRLKQCAAILALHAQPEPGRARDAAMQLPQVARRSA